MRSAVQQPVSTEICQTGEENDAEAQPGQPQAVRIKTIRSLSFSGRYFADCNTWRPDISISGHGWSFWQSSSLSDGSAVQPYMILPARCRSLRQGRMPDTDHTARRQDQYEYPIRDYEGIKQNGIVCHSQLVRVARCKVKNLVLSTLKTGWTRWFIL
jgi:hypothetical protein